MDTTVIDDSTGNSTSNAHSRRRIVQGAAWSLPVIALAVAAPSASASLAPVEEKYTFSGNTNTQTIGGVIRNVSLTGGNFTLEGPVGTSTGVITLEATFPDGYTEWAPAAELYSWTWKEEFIDGLKVVTFTHPGVEVTTAGVPASVWFAGIVLIGSGASKRNAATFGFDCANYTGGGLYAPK